MKIEVIWHHVVFEETAIGICDALFISGFESNVRQVKPTDGFCQDVLYVILGLHRFNTVPKQYIAVQAEQLGSTWMTESYITNLRRAMCVWDFSPRNCEYFQEKGIVCFNVRTRVPMGIFFPGSSSMRKHFSSRVKDIDVLFYGAPCPRRENLEKEFKRTNLRVVFRFNDLFQDEREDLISRSKVVLNIHYWPSASLETHRVEYLCSRGKCVISERSSDSELDSEYSGSVAFAHFSRIVNIAQYYATNDQEREDLEAKSQRKCFKTQSDTKSIAKSINLKVQTNAGQR